MTYKKNWRPSVRKLWNECTTTFPLDHAEAKEILTVACDSLENYYRARDTIYLEGLTYKTNSGLIKRHPASAIMRQERTGFLAAMKSLNLEWDPDAEPVVMGRPREGIGV